MISRPRWRGNFFFIVRSRVWKLGVDNFGAGSTTVSGDGHTISVMDSPPQNGYRKCRNTNSFPSISNGLPLRRLWYFRFFHSWRSFFPIWVFHEAQLNRLVTTVFGLVESNCSSNCYPAFAFKFPLSGWASVVFRIAQFVGFCLCVGLFKILDSAPYIFGIGKKFCWFQSGRTTEWLFGL